MKRTSCFLIITFAGSLAIGCGGRHAPDTAADVEGAVPFDLAAMRKVIEGKNARFTQAHITGDSAVLIDYFTPDAKVFAPNATAVIGQEAIAVLNREYVEYGITEFTEVTTGFYGDENYLIDEGTYFMRYGKDNVIEEGKYLNVWKKAGGEWRVCANMWNADQ